MQEVRLTSSGKTIPNEKAMQLPLFPKAPKFISSWKYVCTRLHPVSKAAQNECLDGMASRGACRRRQQIAYLELSLVYSLTTDLPKWLVYPGCQHVYNSSYPMTTMVTYRSRKLCWGAEVA